MKGGAINAALFCRICQILDYTQPVSSTLAHAASASWIAVTAAHVRPDETSYIVAALISASILDVDHLFFMIRDRVMYRQVGYRGNLHHARSVFH